MARVGYVRYPSGQFLDEEKLVALLSRATSEKAPRREGMLAGWGFVAEWFGITGQLSTFAEHALEYGQLSGVNEAMADMGIAFAFAQAAIDFAEGKPKKAMLNLVKNIGNYYAVKAINTRYINLAFIAVFAIDYSLDKFANAALDGRFKIYERAYRLYYSERRRKKGERAPYWYKRLSRLMKRTRPGADIGAVIKRDLEGYVNEFWQNPEVVAEYMERVTKHPWTGFGGLNPKVEGDLARYHMAELLQYLQSALARLFREVSWGYQDKAKVKLDAAAKGLNAVRKIKVVVKPPEPKEGEQDPPKVELKGLQVRFGVSVKDPEQRKLWQGVTDEDGVFELRCTTLGYLNSGAPRKVTLVIPAEEEDEQDQELEAVLVLRPPGKVTLVQFNLGVPTLSGTWDTKGPGVVTETRGGSTITRKDTFTGKIDFDKLLREGCRQGQEGKFITLTSPASWAGRRDRHKHLKYWITFEGRDRFTARCVQQWQDGRVDRIKLKGRRLE